MITTKSNTLHDSRFRLLVENIKDYAIYMLTPDGKVMSWNAGAERFKGYTADEVIGKSFSLFYTPEDRASGLPAKALAIATKEGRFESEGWRVRKDGTQFWASVVIDPVSDEDGRAIGFAKITRDMTDRKIALEALRRSEENFRLLVKGVTDYAIYMLSPEGMVTNWNPGAERIKGYQDVEVLNTHFSRFYTPEDREKGMPERALRIADETGSFESEGWRIRKDGTRFWAHVVIDLVKDDQGNKIGFAKITRDITERRRAEQAIEETRAALVQSQKTEAIGRLTGGIAHDFNNLLGAIMGNLDLMRLHLQQGKAGDLATLLEAAAAATRRSAALTHRLLAYARRQTLTPTRVDVSEMVTSMVELLQRSVGPNIRISPMLDRAAWPTLCDRNQLESALLNLVINSRDAMPEGGTISIRTSNVPAEDIVREGDGKPPGKRAGSKAAGARNRAHKLPADAALKDYVLLEVADTGFGMSTDIIAHAFEPFYTTKALGEGTGLGLSMVHGFITQSGGHVTVESAVGSGTRFCLFLPGHAGDASLPAEADEGHSDSATGMPAQAGSRTILLVDDEAGVRTPLKDMLEYAGYTVLEAGDATEALRVFGAARKIDMLLTDIGLPGGMNGRQLAGAVRATAPQLKVMFITGYADLSVIGGSPLDERTRVLSKPFTMESFLAEVQGLAEIKEPA